MVGGSGRSGSGSGRSGSSEVLVVVVRVLMIEIGNRTCSIDTDTDGFAGFLKCHTKLLFSNFWRNTNTSLGESEEFLHHPLNKKQGKIEAFERLSMHDKLNGNSINVIPFTKHVEEFPVPRIADQFP